MSEKRDIIQTDEMVSRRCWIVKDVSSVAVTAFQTPEYATQER